MSSSVAVTVFVSSVIVLCVKVAETATNVCPLGHEKPPVDTELVGTTTLPVICPFLSTVRVAVVPAGSVTVVLFEADGFLPPPLTQPKVAVTNVLKV